MSEDKKFEALLEADPTAEQIFALGMTSERAAAQAILEGKRLTAEQIFELGMTHGFWVASSAIKALGSSLSPEQVVALARRGARRAAITHCAPRLSAHEIVEFVFLCNKDDRQAAAEAAIRLASSRLTDSQLFKLGMVGKQPAMASLKLCFDRLTSDQSKELIALL